AVRRAHRLDARGPPWARPGERRGDAGGHGGGRDGSRSTGRRATGAVAGAARSAGCPPPPAFSPPGSGWGGRAPHVVSGVERLGGGCYTSGAMMGGGRWFPWGMALASLVCRSPGPAGAAETGVSAPADQVRVLSATSGTSVVTVRATPAAAIEDRTPGSKPV